MHTHLAVIILNYRTPDLTIDCLASIEGEIRDDIRVVVVDNNSSDGSCDSIDDAIDRNGWGSWCRLIRSEVNGGFAAGNNIGIRSIEAESYMLLNSDTIVRSGAFGSLLDVLSQRPDVGLIAPRIEKLNGELDQNTFRFVSPLSELIRSANTGPITLLLRNFDVVLEPRGQPFEPQWVGFACVVIRKEVLDQIGLLDESFFMYFEDIDYCRRAHDRGWKLLYWPEARVVHLLGGSSGVTKKSNLRRRPPKYFYESRTAYFKKHFGTTGYVAANVLWTTGRCLSFVREQLSHRPPVHREREALDIWISAVSRYKNTSP